MWILNLKLLAKWFCHAIALLLAITLPFIMSCNAVAQETEAVREFQKDNLMIDAHIHATVMTPTTPPTMTILITTRSFSDNTEDDAERDNARLIYPFGDTWGGLFEHATWLFTNGSFIFSPSSAAEFPRLGQVLLAGSYTVEHGVYEIHGEVRTPWETTSSIDGWLVPIEGGYRLEALHVVTYSGYSQVEQIRQELRQAPATDEIVTSTLHLLETQSAEVTRERQQAPAIADAEIEALLQELGQAPATAEVEETVRALADEPRRALTEQQTYVAGIPLLTEYDVRLQGSVDGIDFGPFEGLLQIGSLKGEGNTRFGALLATKNMDQPGVIVWSNERSVHTTDKPLQTEIIGTVAIQDNEVKVEISDEDTSNTSSWRTIDATGPQADDETSFVAMSRGRLTFTITGEEIRGEVRGEGMRLPMLRVPSRYWATFTGHRRVSKRVQEQQAVTGLYRFDGHWRTNDAARHSLRLTQKENEIIGTYQDDRYLEGTAHEDRMSFTLSHGQLQGERGFLRALRGGQYLVGYIGQPKEGGEPRWLIAERDKPAPMEGHMVTKDDIYAARILANDLVSAGKCRQALDSLQPIFQDYMQAYKVAQENQALRSWDKEEYLIQLSAAVHPLITCAFELGEYKNLVDHLNQALQLTHALSPEQDMLRLLTDRIQKSKDAASSQNETFALLHQNVALLQSMVNRGGIGIEFAIRDPGGEPIVTGVAPGRPAEMAGMAMGDVLIAVDGKALSGLGTYEVADRLLGPAGSSVQVSIRREGQIHDLVMVRTLSGQLSPNRQGEVAQVLEQEVADLIRTQAILASVPEAKTITDETSGPQALRRLQATFATRAEQLLAIQRDALARIHRLYSDYPDILGPLDQLFNFIEHSRLNPDPIDVVAAQAAEEAENTVKERIGQHPTLSDIEKNLLRQQMYIVSTLTQAVLHLSVEANFIEKLQVEKRHTERGKRTQEAATNLGKWLEQWRQRLQTDPAKIAALEAGQAFFNEAIRLYLELNLPEEALVVAEAGRARAFADLVAARTTVVKDDDIILSEVNAPPLTLPNLQETVKAGASTAVEYFVLDDRILIWVITPTGTIEMRSSPVSKTALEQDVKRFVALLERPSEVDLMKEKEAMAQTQAELWPLLEGFYARLIAPIKDLLPNPEPDKQEEAPVVTLVPHGPLFRLPFAAFKTPQAETDHFFIEDYALVYAPSLGVLRHIQQMKREVAQRGRPTLLALVNPTFGAQAVDSQSRPFDQLPATERYFDKIARYYARDPQILPGRKATKEAFLAAAQAYDVIYFATHAEADEDDPRRSYIMLTENRLRVLDIAKTRLRAQLVILGACQTSRGRITGDGVEGLARQFFGAGTPALLATLWSVFEKQTLEQSFLFHEYWLGQGKSKAAALREAQLQGRWQFPNQIKPWAGFILVGLWQ